MIPLFKPYMPKELPKLEEILHSGALAYGKYGREFEKKLTDWIGCKNVLVTNSFNSAALVLIEAMGLKPGDEVISSPMTCLASNQPFATQNLKVKWADIDPQTGTLDPESVRKSITVNTKAIFHNHFCGYVGYVDEINRIGKEKGLYVIDDAIEAFGSEYKNKRMGNLGSDAALMSFQTVRLPNSIDGGGISFGNKELFERALLIRDYGIERSRFRDSLNEISAACDISIPGYGATLSDVNSYVGCLQMNEIDSLLARQRNNFRKWDSICEAESISTIRSIKESIPNGWVFGILGTNKEQTIIDWRNKGYYASGVHLPNTYYSVFGNNRDLKGVYEFYSKFVALPCGWWFKV